MRYRSSNRWSRCRNRLFSNRSRLVKNHRLAAPIEVMHSHIAEVLNVRPQIFFCHDLYAIAPEPLLVVQRVFQRRLLGLLRKHELHLALFDLILRNAAGLHRLSSNQRRRRHSAVDAPVSQHP